MMERSTVVANDAASSSPEDPSISELREKHRRERENLTLMKQPIKTTRLFTIATVDYLKKLILYILKSGGRVALLFFLIATMCIVLIFVDGPHEKHVDEALEYMRFGLWWVALGMASSIGLGSGLHTFVLYLGPHIALFTIKAVQCGRVDLKTAPYDTIQLKRTPSWLDKDCSEFGPPLFPSTTASLVRVPLSKLLPQIQLEAVLWGFGTALGELPPYFISRAARLSGTRSEPIEELDDESHNEGLFSSFFKRMKHWLLSQSQHLNFSTILILASVPNPLFDLAGIMCGQFGVPFWKFFIATLTGKAFIKAHIQTVFLISLCNNSLLEFVETRLIWLLGHIPGFSTVLPSIVAKLQSAKEKFLSSSLTSSATSQVKGAKWNFSFTLVWNTVIWLMVAHFFVTIVTSTAQRYLKKQQDLEMAGRLSALNDRSAADLNGAASSS
ncbi:Vacuole membrane protein 1 [Rhynchospora pubera]|uniref:Vacuole membrane protein 1 n=1 Tax=Rhynchospora pubera TaxID=906938 RepID=A0AAV8FHE5_9POAL|nr:Vacuole membrane protein 1 [Rhynchospora pubera]KAJ4792464.1 Vacuole membrane protein 1 [Rhynchospora pubera]KAJ4816276.1 Vacuole membrane protein 1 [Rhynchospora pubera]